MNSDRISRNMESAARAMRALLTTDDPRLQLQAAKKLESAACQLRRALKSAEEPHMSQAEFDKALDDLDAVLAAQAAGDADEEAR